MNNQPTTARIALKWGLITGVALIVYSTLLYTFDQTTNTALSLIVYAILIGGLTMGMREYRTANEGYMTYGEGVGLGALLSAVAGFLSSTFTVLYTRVIDPGFQERVSEQVREKLEDQGQLSDDQIDQAVGMMQTGPGLQFIFGVLGTILIGVIFSLVIAAFLRRNKTNPFD
ncbi:DUF4199 domain-containing protein [Spirosoma areae]